MGTPFRGLALNRRGKNVSERLAEARVCGTAQRFGELDPGQPHYIHCKSGVRSLKAVEFLKAQGFRDVKSVRGGILAWAQEIDPRVPQY